MDSGFWQPTGLDFGFGILDRFGFLDFARILQFLPGFLPKPKQRFVCNVVVCCALFVFFAFGVFRSGAVQYGTVWFGTACYGTACVHLCGHMFVRLGQEGGEDRQLYYVVVIVIHSSCCT